MKCFVLEISCGSHICLPNFLGDCYFSADKNHESKEGCIKYTAGVNRSTWRKYRLILKRFWRREEAISN